MATPGKYNPEIYQGDTWTFEIVYKANGVVVDLTGYTARMQIRKDPSSDTILLTPSIAITPLEGKIVASATPAETEALNSGKAYYDLEITSAGGIVTTILKGQVVILQEVTR